MSSKSKIALNNIFLHYRADRLQKAPWTALSAFIKVESLFLDQSPVAQQRQISDIKVHIYIVWEIFFVCEEKHLHFPSYENNILHEYIFHVSNINTFY